MNTVTYYVAEDGQDINGQHELYITTDTEHELIDGYPTYQEALDAINELVEEDTTYYTNAK